MSNFLVCAPGTEALAATVATKKGVRIGKRFTIWRLEAKKTESGGK